MMLCVGDLSADRRPVHMHVKDRKEDPDTPAFRLQDLVLVDLQNVHDNAISCRDHDVISWWNLALRIAEEVRAEKHEQRTDNHQPPPMNDRRRCLLYTSPSPRDS